LVIETWSLVILLVAIRDAQLDRSSVAGEAFFVGERDDVVGDCGETAFGKVDDAAGADEVIGRQAAGEASRSACG
jgi:hypothetical protein